MLHLLILLLVGFVILVKGADIFVESSCNIAQIFRVPVVIIGIVIIGFGTSLPELAVNINAIVKNLHALGISAVVGSNIFNLLIIIGTIALFKPVHIKRKMFKFEFPFLLIASVVLVFCMLDHYIFHNGNQLTHLDGAILLTIFVVFLFFIFKLSVSHRKSTQEELSEFDLSNKEKLETDGNTLSLKEELRIGDNILSLIAGIVFVIYGSNMVINTSVQAALRFGLSQHLVGLTIVAIGTSLPEYVTSIIAALKNKQDIIIGNIIGSNIFNILFILGIASSIKSLALNNTMAIDAIVCLSVAVLLAIFSFWKKVITRWTGLLFIGVYAVYFAYVVMNR